MSWTVERRGRVAVVTMATNPVNAQNRAFFADLHAAFDELEAEHPDSPVVLTGHRRRFSAGLDLDEHFRLSAGPPEPVAAWFADYRATNIRIFTYPRPTVAAVNGHAFAGGLITSAVCDHRIAIDTDARFALNEVPIGIPCRRYTSASSLTPGARRPPPAPACSAKPSARTRRCNSASSTSSSQRTSCSTAPSRSPSRSLATASSSTPSPKRATQAAALRDIADLADPLDTELPTWMTSDNSQHAHRRYWTQLKSAEPRW